ncbi:hypothetical protein M440DRAFT_1121119 [Trichoderma longibrachiatum ATCC 18648]|uniref:Uncharacterized protein n=1 Tax=Trichoderma longibrachiatum ATCC 18648 TaxID=983965 RepID=A0A2T4CFH7_TRILO|nr:hypothetical protein M440DRAFT_1121119 [Trichoderma longibrachiatum ATCC 18648]
MEINSPYLWYEAQVCHEAWRLQLCQSPCRRGGSTVNCLRATRATRHSQLVGQEGYCTSPFPQRHGHFIPRRIRRA